VFRNRFLLRRIYTKDQKTVKQWTVIFKLLDENLIYWLSMVTRILGKSLLRVYKKNFILAINYSFICLFILYLII